MTADPAPAHRVTGAGVRPPRQRRSRERLERILAAAEELVAERGFDGTSVQDIVARAGTSVGAFYGRFDDKEALLLALHERFLAARLADAAPRLDPAAWPADATLRELVEGTLGHILGQVTANAGLARAFILATAGNAELRQRLAVALRALAGPFGALLLTRRDQIAHPDPETAVDVAFRMAVSTMQLSFLLDDPSARRHEPERLAAEAVRAVLAYLGAGA